MTHARFTPLLSQLPASVPFVGPETQERVRGSAFDARLGANESVFGPSPKAIAALQSASAEIWKYGDPTSFELRRALARYHQISPENIVVGEGIDGLLGYLARMVIGPGDVVVTSDGAYPTFNYHVSGFGGILHKVPYKEDAEDLPALLEEAGRVGAKLIYFANPDNPMGTWHSGAFIVECLAHLPMQTLLILDEAYIEFAPDGTAVKVAIDDPRIIRMRTFSKGYGLAGARVGYALGAQDLIGQFEKIRNHFGMNRAAQIAAEAALNDQAWLFSVRDKVEASKQEIARIADENGLSIVESATNFMAIDCGRDGVFAQAVLTHLLKLGLFVRMPFVAPQNRCIRVSAGRPEDMDLLRSALPKALAAAASAGRANHPGSSL